MKRIIICGGLAVAVVLMVASTARAEIAGIKDVSACPKIIENKKDLLDALNNLSPQSQPASLYFQSDKGRFVFCMDKTAGNENVKIKTPTILSNTTQYPVIIYDITVDSTYASVGQPLLTTSGLILLQKLSAPDLRGPIVMEGSASMFDSTLSCDTTNAGFYPNKILMVTGTGETLTKVDVANCNEAIEVSGTGNILKDITVTFDKTKSATGMDGGKGIVLGSANKLTATSLGGTTISGYASALEMLSSATATNVVANGPVIMKESAKLSGSTINGTIHVDGNNALITKSTLAGDPAMAILKGVTGVSATQNTFTKENTIAYVDPDDAKARTLFASDWMGVAEVDDVDINGNKVAIATRIIGRLEDPSNTSKEVEVVLRKEMPDKTFNFVYFKTCNILTVAKEDKVGIAEKLFTPGERFFDCDLTTDIQGRPTKILMTDHLRFISNTPAVSLMSGDNGLDSLKPTIIAIAESTVTIGTELTGDQPSNPTGEGAPELPNPVDVADTTTATANNDGNNATSGVVSLGGEGVAGVGGAGDAGATSLAGSLTSGAGCSLAPVGANPSQTANALVWVLALLPIPLLLPFRNSKKDDK